MKIAFVTNLCTHYRIKTYETLAKYHGVDYYFYSAGDEWYWQAQHKRHAGQFQHEYLRNVSIGPVHITPTLIPRLWQTKYDAYIKCINDRFALPITYLIARLRRKPFILWTGIWTRLQTPVHKMLFPFTRYIYHHADAIVVYGEHVKRYLISEGVSPERIFVAAQAVDNQAYNYVVTEEELNHLRKTLQIEPHQKVVLYLGRLETGKGLDHLVKAFASLNTKDRILVLAGTGSEENKLKQLVKEEKIEEQVRFPGYIPTNATVPYYALAWVYVLPSITTKTIKETWGLVVNEAFNQGVPVIATDAVGAAAGGLVQHHINGFITPEQDSQALADALHKILTDDELHASLSVNAKNIIATWDIETMVQGFRAAIDYVTASTTDSETALSLQSLSSYNTTAQTLEN